MSKKTEVSNVAYYNEFAHKSLLGLIARETERLNRLILIWDKLEVEPLGLDDFPHLIGNNSDYFKNLYQDRVWGMIDTLKIPTPVKQNLLKDSQSIHFPELITLMDNSRLSSARSGLIPIGGGFRHFEMLPEYFEFEDGKVIQAKDIEAKTAGLFQILADSPDKAKAIELLHGIAADLTLVTQLLDRTGLYAAIENPLIDRSPLFSLDDAKYSARVEALL